MYSFEPAKLSWLILIETRRWFGCFVPTTRLLLTLLFFNFQLVKSSLCRAFCKKKQFWIGNDCILKSFSFATSFNEKKGQYMQKTIWDLLQGLLNVWKFPYKRLKLLIHQIHDWLWWIWKKVLKIPFALVDLLNTKRYTNTNINTNTTKIQIKIQKFATVVPPKTVGSGGSAVAIKPGEAQFLCSRKQMLKEFEKKSWKVLKRNILKENKCWKNLKGNHERF